tara:strand:+ start:160 stop:1149 length:990 start_codon:yes stop_codon:yes gene_type:complete
MISIEKYNSNLKNIWNKFVKNSNNGTIFQNRDFINYHIDRSFIDNSLVIKKNGVVVSLLPATIKVVKNKKILHSHPGASYGGLVFGFSLSFSTLNEIIKSLDNYCISSSFHSIILINTPSIYFEQPDESLSYLLQWHKYNVKELYVSHVVDLRQNDNLFKLLTKRKLRYINNSSDKNKFEFKLSSNFNAFYDILLETKKKYNSKPTHSLDELIKLKELFQQECLLLTTFVDKKIVGGCLLFFVNKKVSLVFYNVVCDSFRDSQLSTFQLYNCMKISKKRGASLVDFGVSHTPEQENPLAPKLSLIQFKEQFGSRGVIRTIFKKDFNLGE